ncbi:hypothetical protein AWENTII_010473 [Aspergillus wentii]
MKLLPSRLTLLAVLCLIQWVSCLPGSAQDTINSTTSAAQNAGNTVQFEITLTWEEGEVAGSKRKMILTNGQFPAPTLQLKQGDDVEFRLNNKLPFATTIHFHGIDQQGTPWSDGVPGLSQRPIQSGDHFLYKWKATSYGAYWYHAHTRGQIEDGLYGAISIQPDDSVERPFSMITDDQEELHAILEAEKNTKPMILSDWHTMTSEQFWKAEEVTGLDGYCVNAMLINGKGSVQCLPRDVINEYTTPAQKASLGNATLTDLACFPPIAATEGNFTHYDILSPQGFFEGCTPSQGPTEVLEVNPAAGWVSWDLICAAGVSAPMFSIDEHPMYVYAIDGRYVEPMRVDAVLLHIGTRYSVMVKLDNLAGDYTIRSANQGVNQIVNATAVMSYASPVKTQKGPSKPYINMIGVNTTQDTVILDEAKVVPFPVEVPSMDVDQTFFVEIQRYNASYRWTLGNSSFPLSAEKVPTPLLFNQSAIPQDLTLRTHNGTWVDVLIHMTGGLQPPHPIHKHSNKYFVIGRGSGVFSYTSVAEAMTHIPESFNFKNPQMRDTFPTLPVTAETTWMAIRYHVVNPGPFLLHCHIQAHLSGGMAMALLDGVDAWPEVPPEYELPVSAN